MGLIPVGYTQPMTCICQNQYPAYGLWVLTGMGAGCPEKPQGSPLHSLMEEAHHPVISVLKSGSVWFWTLMRCNHNHNQFGLRTHIQVTGLNHLQLVYNSPFAV